MKPTSGTLSASAKPSEKIDFYSQQWRDAINKNKIFRMGDDGCFNGFDFGEEYFFIRAVTTTKQAIKIYRAGGEPHPFHEIAISLYYSGSGGIVCDADWAIKKGADYNFLLLRFGDIVDYLSSGGKLQTRESSALGWATPVDTVGIQNVKPSDEVLPPILQAHLCATMRKMGVSNPRVSLLIDRLGMKSLVFNLHEDLGEDAEIVFEAGRYLNWYLPGHYAQVHYYNDRDVAMHQLEDAIKVHNEL